MQFIKYPGIYKVSLIAAYMQGESLLYKQSFWLTNGVMRAKDALQYHMLQPFLLTNFA